MQLRQGREVRPAATRKRQLAAVEHPEPVVMTLGAVALWLALVVGLEQVSHHVFGMTTQDAWAFAIAILSYVALFIGFVIGLVYMVRREEASYSKHS
jgi:hypothetical protein